MDTSIETTLEEFSAASMTVDNHNHLHAQLDHCTMLELLGKETAESVHLHMLLLIQQCDWIEARHLWRRQEWQYAAVLETLYAIVRLALQADYAAVVQTLKTVNNRELLDGFRRFVLKDWTEPPMYYSNVLGMTQQELREYCTALRRSKQEPLTDRVAFVEFRNTQL